MSARDLNTASSADTLARLNISTTATASSSVYSVRRKSDGRIVYESSALLEAEMVAIGLALASHYSAYAEYEVRNGVLVLNTITTDTAFGAMQVKMRNLIFNRKITKRMPYVPDRFTGLAHTKIMSAIRRDRGLDSVKDRLDTAVDEYAQQVRELLT